ncbi:MAG: hypothetical protein OXI01_06330 [Albidovulum sp.]|nr:hypothetical protein [Albidovulum sp.]
MIRREEPAALLVAAGLAGFLHSRLRLGEEKEARERIAPQSKTDEGSPDPLERMASIGRTAGGAKEGEFRFSRPEYLLSFFGGAGSVVSRIVEPERNERRNPDIPEKAGIPRAALEKGGESARRFPARPLSKRFPAKRPPAGRIGFRLSAISRRL